MKKFPHLVQMHRTHAAEGLVCMSVNSADTEPDVREKAAKFLREQGATFPNLLLNDTEANEEKWKDRYPTFPTPLVMLFDRRGKLVRVDTNPKDETIEAEVKKLLAEQ